MRFKTDSLETSILRQISDSVVVIDREGRIVYWNGGAEKMFGYAASEMLGRRGDNLYVHDESKEFAKDLKRISRGEDYVGEWKAKRKNGETFWINVKVNVRRDAKGKINSYIGVARDITRAHFITS